MPVHNDGYYRVLINTCRYSPIGGYRISVIEYWYSICNYTDACGPDGWLRITEGRDAAIEQVKRLIGEAQ